MAFITSDTIRDISVKSVEMFLNDKIPLSVGLAKQASAMELNSDQIQRAVEATNSIAYLKVLSLADDRTMEFPLCKYAEVMASVAIPETKTIVKMASNPGKTNFPQTLELVNERLIDDAEKHVQFVKLAAINAAELESLKDRSVTLASELTKCAALVAKDTQGLEKLTTVCNGKDFAMLTTLVYGERKEHADTGLFKTAELKTVSNLIGLLKEAQTVRQNVKEKTELSERSEFVKQAFLNAVGSGIGRMVGATIGAPIKAIAKGTAAGAGNLASMAKSKITGAPAVIKKTGLVGALGTAGMIGLDASLYKPGSDPATGTSKDVWTALQRQ